MFKDSLFDPAGPVSAATRDLFFDSVGLMLIVVAPVFLLVGFVLWRYRAGTGAAYKPHWAGSRAVEIGIWFMPVVIVVALWFIVWNRTHALDPYKPIASGLPPLVVQAVALDWQWLFIYPDENVAAVNRLVFPVGRPLTIELTSDTVMNSLSIPALGGQIYAMAGMETQLNLLADRPGVYDGRNTMFSGDGFSAQTFAAEAVDVSGFQSFLAQARASGDALDAAGFETLSTPTIAGPVRLYSTVEPKLFHTIMAAHGSMPEMAPAANHAEHAP
ncbi:cytochrome bo3 quinol oxidase subunit 2 [Devosia sp. YR412]|uniref:COX aromatic rich motif-containing protein n=1 Tax=Devosia sp. YR412 TaxID=1881030 RepID=UPI0008B1CF83|nr:COX aromatic rich motif-containing protein [Devosia sp. YR412]SEQ41637.1 cytochrome bo3 quinol oxidase subunit 2 [Devosia sp. YR412]